MTTLQTPPLALLRTEEELPFVDLGEQGLVQLLQVDLTNGVWVVRTRFRPGTTLPTHRHTGHVHAFTNQGSWHYLEYPDSVNEAGSYLFEPAGSVHTLHVPGSNEDITDVWFVVEGANLNLDKDGKVESVLDAQIILGAYRVLCSEQYGLENLPVVLIGPP